MNHLTLPIAEQIIRHRGATLSNYDFYIWQNEFVDILEQQNARPELTFFCLDLILQILF